VRVSIGRVVDGVANEGHNAERRKIDMATNPEACLARKRANWEKWMKVTKKRS
jgi:hypothetical protein